LIILVLWGGYLRFESLGNQSFWMDEAFSVAVATSIQEHGYPLLDSGQEVWRSFPVDYIMSVGLYLFDDPQVGGRVFTALAGTLLILMFYLFNLQIFKSRRQALIATALMTFMTYEIAWSRQARMYMFLQLFMVTSLYFYYRFLEHKKRLPLVMAFIFAALSIYTHQAGYVVAVAILLTTLIDVREFSPWISWIKRNKGFSVGFLIVFGIFAYSLFTINSGSSLAEAVENARQQFNFDYSLNYLKFLFIQLGIFLPVGVIGFFASAWKRKQQYILAIAISVVIYFLLISFRNSLFHFRYILPIVPFIIVFVAYALDQLFELLKKYHITSSVFAGVIIIAIMASWGFNFLPKDEYVLGRTAPQPDWKTGYEWITNDAGDEEIVTISTYPVFHDIYLGKDKGEKYYLAFEGFGYPGKVLEKSRYARSELISTLEELNQKKGYLILDDFGFRMLWDKEIRDYLNILKPVIFEGQYKLMVWKL